jgi:peptide/nickel transport system substrate-binding protein
MMKFFVALLSVFLLFSACSKEPGTGGKTAENPVRNYQPAYGDAIRVGSIGDASNLIPILASDSSSHGITGLVYNGLIKYNKDIEIVGDLADRWEISGDGLVITFHLRKGVKWHDGYPLTAQDVLYSYKVIIDPSTPTAYAGDFLQVKKAEVVDDYTFRVTYPQPFAPALASWAMSVLPRHLLEGKDIKVSPLIRHPIGTGPYRFIRWTTGQEIVLKSNQDYFEGKPYISEYDYRIIPDTATMFLELKSGGIDWMGLTPIQYTRQTSNIQFLQQFNRFRYLAPSYTYLGYNLLSPLFQDRRVRQALSYAIDKDSIIKGVLLGLGQAATGPYKPDSLWYNPHVKSYSYDPKKAAALLKEAGWIDSDGDGWLDKNGQPFSFVIITNQGNDIRARTGVIIQDNLKKIGIQVKLRVIEWAAFLKQFIDKKNFEATILGWTIPPDPDLYDIWHSSKIKPGELNFISYKNPELDRFIEMGRHTFDREKRKEYYFKMQEILAEDQPYTFLFVPDALTAISSRFKGIQPAPAGITYDFIKWYVPSELQKYTITP